MSMYLNSRSPIVSIVMGWQWPTMYFPCPKNTRYPSIAPISGSIILMLVTSYTPTFHESHSSLVSPPSQDHPWMVLTSYQSLYKYIRKHWKYTCWKTLAGMTSKFVGVASISFCFLINQHSFACVTKSNTSVCWLIKIHTAIWSTLHMREKM